MKLKNQKIKKYTLTKLHLSKYQAYKGSLYSFADSKILENLELTLKQALSLIHLYHSRNKRILFIGFPYIKNKYILKYLKHSFLPKNLWVKGLFGNKTSVFKKLKNKNSILKTFSTQNNPDLIVFFNPKIGDTVILQELYKTGRPLICLGTEPNFNLSCTTYNVPAFFFNKKLKQFCSFLVHSILKTPISA
jgi:hypothetical protein